MKVLWLLLIAALPLQSFEEKRPIRLENLNPNQKVRIEWRLPGEFSLVQDYELNIHVAADIQLEFRDLLKPESAENRSVKVYLSKEELKSLDKALDLYREQKVIFCGDVPVHNVTISLFEDDQLKSKESFNNRCLHSKLSELIDALEPQIACNVMDE